MEKVSLTKLTNIKNMEKALTISKTIKGLERSKAALQKKKKSTRSFLYVYFDQQYEYSKVKVLLPLSAIVNVIDKAIEEEINNLLELGFTI